MPHVQICHLYAPCQLSAQSASPPPGRFCYALGSQGMRGKSVEECDNIHFLSTEDDAAAHNVYELIHRWRSWYLVGETRALLPSHWLGYMFPSSSETNEDHQRPHTSLEVFSPEKQKGRQKLDVMPASVEGSSRKRKHEGEPLERPRTSHG